MDNKMVVNRLSRPDLLEQCIATLEKGAGLKVVSSQSTYDYLVRIDYMAKTSECELFVMSESLGTFNLHDTEGADGLFASFVRSLLHDLGGDYVPSSILLPCSLTMYGGFDFFWFFDRSSFISDYTKKYLKALLSNISVKCDTKSKAKERSDYTYNRFISGSMDATEKRRWFISFICRYSYDRNVLERKLNESTETSSGTWSVSKDTELLTMIIRRVDKESGIESIFYVKLIKKVF